MGSRWCRSGWISHAQSPAKTGKHIFATGGGCDCDTFHQDNMVTGVALDSNFKLLLMSRILVAVETRQIWGIWKLRPAYSPETPNLGQNRWCFNPCDLEIWWMTLENNRVSLLSCFKLCVTFHSHPWIKTGVTVRKRPIWVKFEVF